MLYIEMLAQEQVAEFWPAVGPMLTAACEAHEIAKDELTPEDIRRLAEEGMCVIFVGFVDGEPACTLVLQFTDMNGHKGVDVVAVGGQHLLLFKAAYWDLILQWLATNGVEYVDAYVPYERINVYRKKFGFDKSCAYVRKTLH